MGVFQNYLRDVLHANPETLGSLESLREIQPAGGADGRHAGRVGGGAHRRSGPAHYGYRDRGERLYAGVCALVAVTIFWSVDFTLGFGASAITLALAKGKEGRRHWGDVGGRLDATWPRWASPAPGPFRPELDYSDFLIAGCIAIAAVLSPALDPCLRDGARRSSSGGSMPVLSAHVPGRLPPSDLSIFASFRAHPVYKVPLTRLRASVRQSILISFTPLPSQDGDRRGERGPLTFYSIALSCLSGDSDVSHRLGALCPFLIISAVQFGVVSPLTCTASPPKN